MINIDNVYLKSIIAETEFDEPQKQREENEINPLGYYKGIEYYPFSQISQFPIFIKDTKGFLIKKELFLKGNYVEEFNFYDEDDELIQNGYAYENINFSKYKILGYVSSSDKKIYILCKPKINWLFILICFVIIILYLFNGVKI